LANAITITELKSTARTDRNRFAGSATQMPEFKQHAFT